MRYAWIMFAVLLCATLMLPVWGQPYMRAVPSGTPGVPQSQITNTTANVAAADTVLTLVVPSRRVTIKTNSAAAICYIDFAGGTATSADFQLDPAGSISYEGEPIQSIHYLGAAATGTISVLAY
jgi:hypothetical protein